MKLTKIDWKWGGKSTKIDWEWGKNRLKLTEMALTISPGRWGETTPNFGRSEKAFRTRRFMSEFLGVSFLRSASKKGRTSEHGPGAPCKLLFSRSFSERSKRSGKGVSERHFISKFLGVSLFCFGGKKERTWERKARTTWNSFSEHPITFGNPPKKSLPLGAVLPHLPVGKKFVRFCVYV